MERSAVMAVRRAVGESGYVRDDNTSQTRCWLTGSNARPIGRAVGSGLGDELLVPAGVNMVTAAHRAVGLNGAICSSATAGHTVVERR